LHPTAMIRTARAYWIVLLLAVAPAVARAQALSGTVRDGVTGAPIAVAVVAIMTADGREIQLVRTNSQGRYSIIPVADAHTLTIRRLGYRPITVDLARRRGDTVIDAAMEQIGTVLEPMVSTAEQCLPNTVSAEARQLWIETGERLRHQPNAVPRRPSKLEVTGYHLSRREQTTPFIAKGTSFTRAFDPETDVLAILPPEWYANDVTYTPPTPELFFDRAFFVQHCFSMQRATAATAGQVGVAFVPLPSLRDFSGVLWIDSVTRAPRSITYVRDRSGTSGGTLTFRSMPGGAPFIDSWQYFSGPVQDDTVVTVPPGVTKRLSRTVMRVRGVALRNAEWSDGTRIEVPSPTVRGRVVDARTSAPRGGVSVRVGGWDIVTGADGFFTVPVPIAEHYATVAVDRAWSAFGLTVTGDPAMLDARNQGAATPVRLASALETARRQCTGSAIGSGPGAVLVRLAGADSDASPLVTLRWMTGRDTVTRTERAQNGALTVCGAAAGTLQVEAPIQRRIGVGTAQISGAATLDTVVVRVPPL
jgi:hypothetical protein